MSARRARGVRRAPDRRGSAPPIEVQRRIVRGVPSSRDLRHWALAALGQRRAELTIRIVGSAESRQLNCRYRGKDKPTNVLSFHYGAAPDGGRCVVGDLVLCAPVVNREAREQGKSRSAHWAHMVVHGVLHLLGHDHIEEPQAKVMEGRERAILARLSFPDPYVVPNE